MVRIVARSSFHACDQSFNTIKHSLLSIKLTIDALTLLVIGALLILPSGQSLLGALIFFHGRNGRCDSIGFCSGVLTMAADGYDDCNKNHYADHCQNPDFRFHRAVTVPWSIQSPPKSLLAIMFTQSRLTSA